MLEAHVFNVQNLFVLLRGEGIHCFFFFLSAFISERYGSFPDTKLLLHRLNLNLILPSSELESSVPASLFFSDKLSATAIPWPCLWRAIVSNEWPLLCAAARGGTSLTWSPPPFRSSHLQSGGTSTKYTVSSTTMKVKLHAETQNVHCVKAMSRISEVFMPKTLATNDSGRNITVMTVKTTAAFSRQSCTPEICARACFRVRIVLRGWADQWL